MPTANPCSDISYETLPRRDVHRDRMSHRKWLDTVVASGIIKTITGHGETNLLAIAGNTVVYHDLKYGIVRKLRPAINPKEVQTRLKGDAEIIQKALPAPIPVPVQTKIHYTSSKLNFHIVETQQAFIEGVDFMAPDFEPTDEMDPEKLEEDFIRISEASAKIFEEHGKYIDCAQSKNVLATPEGLRLIDMELPFDLMPVEPIAA